MLDNSREVMFRLVNAEVDKAEKAKTGFSTSMRAFGGEEKSVGKFLFSVQWLS